MPDATCAAARPVRAAIYCRVSTPDQAKAKPLGLAQDAVQEPSPAQQEAACRALAAERGYVVSEAHVYREVHTRVELWEREQLTALREAIKRREVDALLCHALDRLSGDPVHQGIVLAEADHWGVAVHCVTETLDHTPEGQLVRYIRGYAARLEWEKIRERTQRGRQTRLRSGKPLAGPRPKYGYAWVDPEPGHKSQLAANDETAAVVRRVYRDLAAGMSARQIARALGAEGVPTPTGIVRDRGWDVGVLTRLVADPAYKGAPAANRRAVWRKKAPAPYFKHESDWLALPEGVAPALVDAATWDRANATVRGEIPHPGANGAWGDVFLLGRGRAVCGWCGAAMVATMSGSNRAWAYYRCGAHKRDPRACRTVSCAARRLDGAALAYLRAQLQAWEEAAVAADIARRTAPREREPAEAVALRRTIARLQKQEGNLRHMGALAETPDEAAGYVVDRRKVLADLKRARDRLDDLTTTDQRGARDARVYHRAAAKLRALLRDANARRAVAAVDLRATVWGAEVDPPWEFRCAPLT